MNFNDPKESLALIDFMNSMINEFDITFICVIHENPGAGQKARGHIGTESLNKASTQIQVSIHELDLGKEAIKVKYLKTRRSKRPADFYMCYSETENCLVLPDKGTMKYIKKSGKSKADIDDVTEYLLETLIARTTRQNLLEDLCTAFECAKNTMLSRLKEIVDTPLEIKGGEEGVVYHLIKKKEGKETFYELEKQSSDSDDKVEQKELFDEEE